MTKRVLQPRFSVFGGSRVFERCCCCPPLVGSPAPEFTLPAQEGVPVSLRDYRGQWVVLYFYPRDFSSGCTVEAHNFQRIRRNTRRKVPWCLGSVSIARLAQAVRTKEGLNFKLLADTKPFVS